MSSRVTGLNDILVLIFAGSSVTTTFFFSCSSDVAAEVVHSPFASVEIEDVECSLDLAVVAARISRDRLRQYSVSRLCVSPGASWEYGWMAGEGGVSKRLRSGPNTLEEAVASLGILNATLCPISFFFALGRDGSETTISSSPSSDTQARVDRPTVGSSCGGAMDLKMESPSPVVASLSQLRTPNEGLVSCEGGRGSSNSIPSVPSFSLSLGMNGEVDGVM